ncbi:hypothetical protein D1AOALGA4SA_6752 [Olavius algarvensis Delta 1 endosymbiont]|nr:hypothetical protein D1AOALGA4SA_6752 [Olavius algarvensis Delta 1 endosymbiont]
MTAYAFSGPYRGLADNMLKVSIYNLHFRISGFAGLGGIDLG